MLSILFEGFGIPIIEALYSGIPVITTKGGCFSEAGGPSSIYIDPVDIKALRNAIETLFNESETSRNKRIEDGLAFVQKFNDEVLVKQWNAIYTSLLP